MISLASEFNLEQQHNPTTENDPYALPWRYFYYDGLNLSVLLCPGVRNIVKITAKPGMSKELQAVVEELAWVLFLLPMLLCLTDVISRDAGIVDAVDCRLTRCSNQPECIPAFGSVPLLRCP